MEIQQKIIFKNHPILTEQQLEESFDDVVRWIKKFLSLFAPGVDNPIGIPAATARRLLLLDRKKITNAVRTFISLINRGDPMPLTNTANIFNINQKVFALIIEAMVESGVIDRKIMEKGNTQIPFEPQLTPAQVKILRYDIVTEQLNEEAPPDKEIEKWIKSNKERFKEKYGDQWEQVIYATAWKMYEKKKSKTEELSEAPVIPFDRRSIKNQLQSLTGHYANREVTVRELTRDLETIFEDAEVTVEKSRREEFVIGAFYDEEEDRQYNFNPNVKAIEIQILVYSKKISEDERWWEIFFNDLLTAYTHEKIHQKQAINRKQTPVKKDDIYHTDPDEIDAYAFEVANELFSAFGNADKARMALRQYKSIPQNASPVLSMYVSQFDRRTIQRLITRANKYLELIKKEKENEAA